MTLIANGFSPFYFQPYPQFTGAVNVIDSNDRSRYNALEIQVSRPLSKGLAFQASYTLANRKTPAPSIRLSRSLTRGGTGQSAANTPFDINNRDLNYARSDFDRRHALQGYVLYELPIGKGRRWGSDWGRTTDFLLGGFNIAGVMRRYSGRPFTVFSGSNTLSQVVFTPASCNDCSPDFGGTRWKTVRTSSSLPNNVRSSSFRRQVRQAMWAETSSMDHRSSISISLSASASGLTRRRTWKFRIEAQNVTNTPSFAVPDGNLILTSGSFGQILGNTTSTSRKVQFVAKFNF